MDVQHGPRRAGNVRLQAGHHHESGQRHRDRAGDDQVPPLDRRRTDEAQGRSRTATRGGQGRRPLSRLRPRLPLARGAAGARLELRQRDGGPLAQARGDLPPPRRRYPGAAPRSFASRNPPRRLDPSGSPRPPRRSRDTGAAASARSRFELTERRLLAPIPRGAPRACSARRSGTRRQLPRGRRKSREAARARLPRRCGDRSRRRGSGGRPQPGIVQQRGGDPARRRTNRRGARRLRIGAAPRSERGGPRGGRVVRGRAGRRLGGRRRRRG